jgi:hypothetical protein
MKSRPIPKLLTLGTLLLLLPITSVLAAGDLTADQVKAKLEAAGYTNVKEIRREAKHFDAEATKDGQKVYLDIDAKTGAISPETEENEEQEHQKEGKKSGG